MSKSAQKFAIGHVFTDPDKRKLKIHGYCEGKYYLHYVIDRSISETALLATGAVKKDDLKIGNTVMFPNRREFILLERQRSATKGSSEGFWFYRDPADVVKTEHELQDLVPPDDWYWQGPPKSPSRRALV